MKKKIDPTKMKIYKVKNKTKKQVKLIKKVQKTR